MELQFNNIIKTITISTTIMFLCSCASTQSTTYYSNPTVENSNKSVQVAEKNVAETINKPIKQTDSQQYAASNIKSWDISGVIGVQEAKEAWSATVNWQQLGLNNYQLRLIGPAGVGTVIVNGKPGNVTLTNSKNETFRAGSSEALFKQQTGLHIPVSHLRYWVRGIPVPGIAANTSMDESNRIATMQQAGWSIQYVRYAQIRGYNLPSKIIMSNSQMKIKMVINSWRVN